ncbi:ZIP family metal transporter [Geothermobacter hydrogeniphilus]|uniref:ZIP family metal transporter n=1 Tax=Geothermobacter hydrogeniphilus TaxID=1969733 RepID=A0A2K2H894_9BACT|nr:ZIP family metal transporter [Geothermobacter hydrogeniphilus]PNU19450.1 ZIP family metal transporter [Geothermobacter hydrogeniphilus]
MFEFIAGFHPVTQAFLATLFTWAMTALGAGVVYVHRAPTRKMLDSMLGFAAGVMIAASYWSLLAPAIEMSEQQGWLPWLPPAVGFLAGGGFLRLVDRFMPHLHINFPLSRAEGVPTRLHRVTLLVLAITLHNIPEGLAVGVAFGAVGAGFDSASLPSAIALALGIGIQNFPEGLAVAVPLRREGISVHRSFMAGQLSGMVEIVAGVLGAATVVYVEPLLPFALAFAAGAMIFVVVEEVIPESQQGDNTDIATLGAMLGFTVMMVLDVALG